MSDNGKKLVIIKNISREGPGLLTDVLTEKGIGYDIIDLSIGQQPGKADDYKAVIVLGGPDSANDSSDKMINELAFVRDALDAGIPYLGICLGMQVLVKAAGGEVLKCEKKEAGFRDNDNQFYKVFLTADGKKDPLFEGIPDSSPVFQLHGETVTLLPSIRLLATGKSCKNQIVKTGSVFYGIQCHLELTPGMLRDWMKEDPDLRPLDPAELNSDLDRLLEDYSETGVRLFRNFLRIAGF